MLSRSLLYADPDAGQTFGVHCQQFDGLFDDLCVFYRDPYRCPKHKPDEPLTWKVGVIVFRHANDDRVQKEKNGKRFWRHISLNFLNSGIPSDYNSPTACRGPRGRARRKLGRPFAFSEVTMFRTIVYIDGFNLYYRALKGTPHKWLDIAQMSSAALPSGHQIGAINYYTARISGRVDPTAPIRQNTYLRALGTLPNVKIHYGNFLVTTKWSPLVQPPEFKPPFILPSGAAPIVAKVIKTEEKGSGVNGAKIRRI